MISINEELGPTIDERHPQDVFQLVAETSTDDLIALMLGKMGLTVDECITQYQELFKKIFRKKHIRGRMTLGLAPTKYCGKHLQRGVEKLLRDRRLDVDLNMAQEPNNVPWYGFCILVSFHEGVSWAACVTSLKLR